MRAVGHDHGAFAGRFADRHEHGFPALGPLPLVVLLVVLLALFAVVLARHDAVRSRLVAVRHLPVVDAALRRAGRGRSAQAPATAVAAAAVAQPARPDLGLVAHAPDDLRRQLARVDDLAASTHLPPAEVTWPERALAEHRLEAVRSELVDLADTLGQVSDVEGPVLDDARATAALLEQEVLALRREVQAGLAARLRRQRAFVTSKYRRPGEPSALDL